MIHSKGWLNGFFIAASLMTVIPFIHWVDVNWSDEEQGRSVAFYPWVGAFLVIILFVPVIFLPAVLPAYLKAALLITGMCALTGALHLDGLADSIDGIAAGHKDKQKIFSVLKDPVCGPMAVVGLVVTLLLKVVALATIFESSGLLSAFITFFCAALMARSAALLMMLTSAYASSSGIASSFSDNIAKIPAFLSLIVTGLVVFLLVGALHFFLLLPVLGVVFYWWRQTWIKRIGGYSGDTLGGLIEITETSVLMFLCIASYTI